MNNSNKKLPKGVKRGTPIATKAVVFIQMNVIMGKNCNPNDIRMKTNLAGDPEELIVSLPDDCNWVKADIISIS